MSITAGTHSSPPLATAALQPSLPVWGLLGRFLLVAIGEVLVIPLPWTAAYFYKFFCEHVTLPDGRRLKFTGTGGDIWYVFMAIPVILGLAQVIGVATQAPGEDPDTTLANALYLAANLICWALAVVIIKWVCAHVKTDDGTLALTFEGNVMAFIGWNIVLILSTLTIIGWAWVLKFFMRWCCRNIKGTLAFDFVGTGLEILWRSIVLWLLCILIIPIPWMLRWYFNWFISQTVVAQPAGATA